MSNLLILGAGGHGKVVAEAALSMNIWDEIAFLDDNEKLKDVLNFKVIGKLNDYICLKESYTDAFVAMGNNYLRIDWLNRLQKHYNIPVIKHPQSIVSKFSKIGEGTVIMAGSIVMTSAIVGKGCILNTGCSIDHDSLLDEGVHISPGVCIGGSVKVGACSWICIGSCISNGITIGKNSIVAAGAAVVSNASDSVLMTGVPARVKKYL